MIDDDFAVGGQVNIVFNGVRAGGVSADGGKGGVLNVFAGHAAMADDQRGAQNRGGVVAEEGKRLDGGLIIVYQHAVCAVGVLRKQRSGIRGSGHPHRGTAALQVLYVFLCGDGLGNQAHLGVAHTTG